MPSYTSLTGYRESVISGSASSQRNRILACLFDSAVPLSRQQIAKLTGIPLNAVCGRANDLLGRGKAANRQAVVKVAYERKHPATNASREYLEPTWPQPKQKSFEEFLR
jgi:chromosome segregation and condensation protein ScpB